MNLAEYQPLAMRKAKWFPALFPNIEHVALGILSEVGEFTTIAKRVAIYGKEFTPEMRAHALEELGDIAWYCALGAEVLNVQLDKIIDPCNDKIVSMAQAALFLGTVASPIAMLVEAQRDGISELMSPFKDSIGLTIGGVLFVSNWLDPDYDVLGANIAKLRQRYPEKYTDEAAEARADKDGADARNS